jgi:hypothetical protein
MVGRAIKWDLIAEQYDQMIKYATAIRAGTTSTEAILRRFAKTNAMHPVYQAMIEVGRAQKTIFLARYLRDRDLQREINEGLNVAESWNRANSVIFFGKGGDIATNRRDEQELSVLCLRAPVRPDLRQHPHAPRRPRRAGLGRRPRRGRPAESDAAILDPRRPLRRGAPGHGGPAAAAHFAAGGGQAGLSGSSVRRCSTRPRRRSGRRLGLHSFP